MPINSVKDFIRRIIGEVPTKTLVKRGLKVGENFNRQQGCFIDPTHCWLIEIGNNVVMSIRVVILAHDASTKIIVGHTKIGKVIIGDNVFFGANSMVLPGVTIGDNSIIGANSVVTGDIPSNVVVAGCPAKIIYTLEEYRKKVSLEFEGSDSVFGNDFLYGRISDAQKQEMKMQLQNSNGYIL